MWVTPHENLTSPVVFYGEKMDDLVNNIKGTWHTYNVGHLGFHGRIYVAYMRNLNPKTKYYYKVGDLLT